MTIKFLVPFALCLTFQVHAQAALCPGSPLASSVLFPARNVTQANLPESHHLAMKMAKAVYGMADLEKRWIFSEAGVATGPEMIDVLRRLTTSVPDGYKIYRSYAEHEYGLKYLIFQPVRDPAQPWIFAIAGTETTLDWIVDVDLGRSQLEKLESLLELFTTCNHMAPDRFPLPAREFIFTGHSLGGGLAQAFAYKIQSRRLRAGLRPLTMATVTFNAFGAKPLVEKTERLDVRIESHVNATNYFVKEDIVSRIGQHIGITKQLTPVGENPEQPLSIRSPGELGRRHSMEMVLSLADQMPWAPVMAPRDFQLLQDLTKLGGVALFVARVLPRRFENERVVKVLQNATAHVIASGFKTAEDQQVRELLISFIQSRLREMDRPSNGLLARYAVQDLRSLLGKLNASRLIIVR